MPRFCRLHQSRQGGHRPAGGIGQRYLALAGSFEIRQHHPVAVALLAERRDLLGEIFRTRAAPPSSTSPSSSRRRSSSNRSSAARMKFCSEFRVLVVDRLAPNSVHGQQRAPKEVELPPKGPRLSRRKSALVLTSGFRFRSSQITSLLRWLSISRRRIQAPTRTAPGSNSRRC
jgi:hypothetical protein